MPYFISCEACAYQEVVQDESMLIEKKEGHEADHGDRHSIGVESVEEQPMFRGGDSTPW